MATRENEVIGDRDNPIARGHEAESGASGEIGLSEAERDKILYEWNDTRAEYPDACVHELFEEQVDRDPDAVALVFKDRRLTYRELNQRANQVAHFLRKHGVGPDTLVGVSLVRSPELVIGLLGVLKAGGAYVPLDPAYPQERLSFMVEDAGIRMLLTEEKCKHLFPSAEDKMVCLDSDWPIIAREAVGNPGRGSVPSHLAYVMYTSGSTGQPKGAMILHSGLVNYLCWAIKAYAVERGGSVPVHTSVSFDLTVTSLYPALLVGGQAELLSEDVGAQNLLAALRRDKNRNLVKITPAHLDLLVQQLGPKEAPGLTKMFVIGGENLVAESLELWREFAPNTRLINEYGPTETVVGCCVYEVGASDPHNGSVPIGRPIANTQLYVLDQNMQPVPPGVKGELYVGGAGVARGYLNRPELTQERFLVDPFSDRVGARIYKTGDLARYRADGILEYLGRIDNQVKVRGYRIELGEIEATLAGHPAVQSCAVLAREDIPGNKQLVGYVVPPSGEPLAIEDIQNFMKLRLPSYMLPSAYVRIDALPLSTNGKIDRKRLPRPEVGNPNGSPPMLPRDDTETRIAAIWRQVLMLSDIGVDQDFFALGGTSALAAQVVAHLEREMDIEIPLQAFYDGPTVEGIAARLGRHFSPDDPIVVRLREGASGRPPLWCVFGVTIYQDLARTLESGQPIIAVHVPNRYVPGRDPQPTIGEVARRYVDLIRKQQEHGPYHLLGLCFGGIVAHEIARQLEALGEAIGLVTILDAMLPTVGQIDQLQRLRSYVGRAWADPKQIPTRLVKSGEKLIARVPVLAKIRASFATPTPAHRPIDLPVDGPEVDAAIDRFASQPHRLTGSLLIVRATREPMPSWMRVAPDHGWGAFGDRVIVHDIAATHLQVLQEPHVRSLAGAIAAESEMSDR